MYKTKARGRHSNSDYDIYGDIENIKAALSAASRDVKGKASEVIAQSLENIREKSSVAQENVADYVSEKPLKAVGISLFAGLILGYLLNLGRK